MIKHSYLTDKVSVCSSGIHRRGIFAVKPIRKDEIIAVWGGFIITQKEFDSLSRNKFRNIDDYATKIAEGFFLVSCKKGGLEDDDFFNHSCNPNAGIKGNILMVAMKDIKPGEEITYDYAMTDADFDYSFQCSCGARDCRKRITTKDWKTPALQRKYKGYFSWYIEEKIRKARKKRSPRPSPDR